MRLLTAWLEDCYCSITVANHQLITIIRFISKSYTHPWIGFANKLRLVLHACKILYSKNLRKKFTVYPNTAYSQRMKCSIMTAILVLGERRRIHKCSTKKADEAVTSAQNGTRRARPEETRVTDWSVAIWPIQSHWIIQGEPVHSTEA